MVLLIGMLIFWFALVGKISIDTAIVGGLLSVFILFFSKRFIFNDKEIYQTNNRLALIIRYLIILVIEIIKANIEMIRIVLFEAAADEHPSIGKFDSHLKSDAAKTMLAHAITLTPGTITIGITDDVFYVTSMNPDMLEGIEELDFVTLLHKLEN